MKNKTTLISLLGEVPALKTDAEGKLLGGFAAIKVSDANQLTSNDSLCKENTSCSGNRICSGNTVCVNDASCDGNVYCYSDTICKDNVGTASTATSNPGTLSESFTSLIF